MDATDFDGWRAGYDKMPFAEHVRFWERLAKEHPEQENADHSAVLRFLSSFEPRIVVEIGGFEGALARDMLRFFPGIEVWDNYEILPDMPQISNSRYRVHRLKDYPWNLAGKVYADTLILAHIIEHMRVKDAMLLLTRFPTVKHLYVEAPIPNDATCHDWTGSWNTHIFEFGWAQLEALLKSFGFSPTMQPPPIRERHFPFRAMGFAR